MKRFIYTVIRRMASIKFMLFAFAIFYVSGVSAQIVKSITGRLVEEKTNQPLPYASVALIRDSDSTMMNGAISDENGAFIIRPLPSGKYGLRISSMGYETKVIQFAVENTEKTDAGTILLHETPIRIKEVEVTGERIKAKSESNKTTFYLTKKIQDASNTGTDVLKLIPGIQIDFNQNISLEGSSNIKILVDGKERDGSFISQLNPKQIDKVEIISKSTSNYDGNSTGAINILLKKERNSGITGQINAEIPTSGSDIYLHPSFTLNGGFKKLNLYTSYKGEMTYLDIHECTSRKTWNESGTIEINSNQYVRQKDWSHRFTFGIDYALNAGNQISLYAFYNPYSRELDGHADLHITGNNNSSWQARKEDSDMNNSAFCSLSYKHKFTKEGREFSLEISDYHLEARKSTEYIQEGNKNSAAIQRNTIEPEQNAVSLKLDYTTPLWNKLNFSTGVKSKFQVMQDRNFRGFEYDEKMVAGYGSVAYQHSKFDLNVGLRAENSVTELKNTFRNPFLSFFPDANFNYKLTSRQHIQLSYSRSVKRPGIYSLNPSNKH